MLTYILWTFSNIQGPSGAETLRFSNVEYVIDSGPNAGQSFQDSWTQASFDSFSIRRNAHAITQSGLLQVGGTVPPSPGEVEVANNFESATSNVRQLDFLFGSDYDLSEVVVTGELKTSSDGTPPAYSSFITFFTGQLARRPTKTSNTVTFYLAPRLADLTGPMLKYRFSGMGSYFSFQSTTAPTESNPPAIIAANHTLQFYGAILLGTAPSGNQTLYKIEDASSVALIDLYLDTSENLKLGVKWASGTDVYTLWTRPIDERGSDDFFWVDVAWDQSGGTMSAWVNDVKVVDATAILHTPTGTPARNVFASVNSTTLVYLSTVRVYNVAHSEEEAIKRHGPIDYAEDSTILNAWEFDDGVGTVCTDYGPSSRHVALPSNNWGFSQLDGDRGQDGRIYPLVLGSAHGVPVTLSSPKQPGGMVSVAGDAVTRAYSKGVPLSQPNFTSSVFAFNHLVGSIKRTTGIWGRSFVPGEEIEVSGSTVPEYDGTYVVKSISPAITGTLKPSGSTDLFSLIVESQAWTTSGNATATVQSSTAVSTNWVKTGLEQSPYNPTGVFDVATIAYSWNLPHPLTADVVGDPTIYVSSPPSGYVNPDDFGNVIAQAVKLYGPAWDNTTFPVSGYAYGDFGYRVGYFISDETPTESVINDLTVGCMVWMEEDGDGVVSLTPFAFPEDIGSGEEIFVDDVDPSSVTTDRFSAAARRSISSPWITSVVTQYARNWSPLQENDVPQTVDPEVRSFVTKEWREVISGDAGKVTTDTPVFTTYENRKAQAQALGDAVLRLSQGEVAEFAVRMSPEDQLTSFLIGAKVTGDLTSVGLGNVDRVVIGRDAGLGSGLLRLSVWFER